MISYSPKDQQDVKVVGIVVPPGPVYAAYYDFQASKVFCKLIVYFVVREFLTKTGDFVSEIKTFPVCLEKNPMEMTEETDYMGNSGFLGITNDPDPKKDSWANEVRELKKRVKNS